MLSGLGRVDVAVIGNWMFHGESTSMRMSYLNATLNPRHLLHMAGWKEQWDSKQYAIPCARMLLDVPECLAAAAPSVDPSEDAPKLSMDEALPKGA